MKKTVFALTALLLLLTLFASCGAEKAQSENVSMYDLREAMLSSSDRFENMQAASSADSGAAVLFGNISDMEYEKISGFFVAYAAEGKGNADEIAVIEVADAGDLREAKESLEKHLATRVSLYTTYDKSQLPKLEKARIVTEGRLAVLIVADEEEKVERAFRDFLKK